MRSGMGGASCQGQDIFTPVCVGGGGERGWGRGPKARISSPLCVFGGRGWGRGQAAGTTNILMSVH